MIWIAGTVISASYNCKIEQAVKHGLFIPKCDYGFAPRLTVEEAKAMEEKDGVLLVRPTTSLQLHTTHSQS